MGNKKCPKCGSYVPYRFVSTVQHNNEVTVTYKCKKCNNIREFKCTVKYYEKNIKRR